MSDGLFARSFPRKDLTIKDLTEYQKEALTHLDVSVGCISGSPEDGALLWASTGSGGTTEII